MSWPREKLVRDRIPEIIERRGETAAIRLVADRAEYRELLRAKLLEEAHEYLEAESEEELADVLEVIRAIARDHGWDMAHIEEVRAAKALERGGFERGFVFTIPEK